MHPYLEKILVGRYPTIFKDHGGDIIVTCMGWGLSCGRGWFKIINELCIKFSKFGTEVVASQVKEKFGGLRFYIGGVPREHSDEIYKAIDEAEIESLKTCEYCGAPGRQTGKGWIKTTCVQCDEKAKFIAGVLESGCRYEIVDGHIELTNLNGIKIYMGSFDDFMNDFADKLQMVHKDILERIEK
jgi:hypothetical protein